MPDMGHWNQTFCESEYDQKVDVTFIFVFSYSLLLSILNDCFFITHQKQNWWIFLD